MTDGAAPARTVLAGVTVVDVRTGVLAVGQDVTIEAGRITAIGPSSAAEGAAGRRIDLTGKYLVPGYLDMHAHILNSPAPQGGLDLMLASGITGFRQMSGTAAQLAERAAGRLHMAPGSPELLVMPGDLLTPVNGATPELAIATVAREQSQGADFIKAAAVGPAAFSAAQAEARRLGIPMAGHLPAAMDPVVASHAGLRCIEHLGPGISMLAACSTEESEIRAILGAAPEIRLPPVKLPGMERIFMAMLKRIVTNPVQRSSPENIALIQRAIDTFSEDKARALAAVFVADGTWNCPTLIRQLTTEWCDHPMFPNDPNHRYVAHSTLKLWRKTAANFQTFTAEQRATFHAEYVLQLRLLKLFDEAGVRMTTGSDSTGGVWNIPGPSLHQEFDQLAEAGLTPLRVLQTATLHGAEFVDRADLGTVEVGTVADLVVLDADPVTSVNALHAVSAVVRAGAFHSGDALAAIKNRVAAARSVD